MSENGSSRRLQKELSEMKKSDNRQFRIVNVDESNLLNWTLLLQPDCKPYNHGAFTVTIEFPKEYPFKPPRVIFNTRIYHPNIDENGLVCLPIIQPDIWKPATRTEQVMNALLSLISEPALDHPLRAKLAEEYQRNRATFNRKAEEFTQQYAEKRT